MGKFEILGFGQLEVSSVLYPHEWQRSRPSQSNHQQFTGHKTLSDCLYYRLCVQAHFRLKFCQPILGTRGLRAGQGTVDLRIHR